MTLPHPTPFFRRAGPAAGPAFLQAVFSSSIVVTSQLPVDDTVPDIAEGAEILSLSVTPQSAASRFLIEAVVFAAPKYAFDIVDDEAVAESATRAWAAALFRGATCIQAHAVDGYVTDDPCGSILRLHLLDAPATSAPVTWTVRVGPGRLLQTGTPTNAGLGLRVNGDYFQEYGAGGIVFDFNHRFFGGRAKCTLVIQELP
jgi:hypothetical protein